MIWTLLVIIGFFVGAFGTLLGVAGGFLLVPILLFIYPDRTPATITTMTLTVAFFNALSGSIAYGRLRRIDFASGILFTITAIPGAVVGAIINNVIDRGIFQIIFGAILLIVAIYLLIKPLRSASLARQKQGTWTRTVIDRYGNTFIYSYNRVPGMVIAFFIGIIAGLLGIGGGIIHVPVLTQVLGFPVHVAIATSQFVVGTSTLSAGVTHLFTSPISGIAGETLVLAAGAVIGAQIGARISRRVPGAVIVRLLAVALGLVAVRLLVAPF